MIVRQEELLSHLVQTSAKVMDYFQGSAGKVIPQSTVKRLILHADNCRKWLLESAGESGLEQWLSGLRPDQRRDFEWSVLPYCLLVNGKSLAETYDLVGDSLGDLTVSQRFPDCPHVDVMELFNLAKVDLHDYNGKHKEVGLATMVIPPIMKDSAMLCPEVYGSIVRLKQFPNVKMVVHAVFNEVVSESMGNRALNAIAWEHEGSKSYKIMRDEIRRYSPKAFPGLRLRLTGTATPSMSECSMRMVGVMEALGEGKLGEVADYLLEAVEMSPVYRKEVLPLDLAESISKMVVIGKGKKSDLEFKNILGNFGSLIDRLSLTTRELNYVMAKSTADIVHNGQIHDLMAGEDHVMLRVFLRYAKSENFDTFQSAASGIYSTLLSRFDPTVLKAAVDEESKLAALVYKLTNDKSYLPLITEGVDLDDCFGRDLGL